MVTFSTLGTCTGVKLVRGFVPESLVETPCVPSAHKTSTSAPPSPIEDIQQATVQQRPDYVQFLKSVKALFFRMFIPQYGAHGVLKANMREPERDSLSGLNQMIAANLSARA